MEDIFEDSSVMKFIDGQLVTINSFDKIISDLKYKFSDLNARIKELSIENAKLKSEVWKDEEIARLKDENKRLYEENLRGFPISEEQEKAIEEWKKKHKSNGGYTYEFFGCAIGVAGSINDGKGHKFEFQSL